jgi:colanic acid/amylovoran biosynthesis protein
METKKVLIINTPGLSNRGSMAVVMGAIDCLLEMLPNAQITILCHHWKTDKDEYTNISKNRHIQVKQHPWFRVHATMLATGLDSGTRSILARFLTKFRLPVKNVFLESDVIIDLNTDALSEAYGLFSPLFSFFNMLLSITAGKPLVVWGTCVVPFKNKLIEHLAKFVLNRAELITLREEASKVYLDTIGVTRPQVQVTADFAFLLKPASQTRLNQVLQPIDIKQLVKPLIGITPAFNKSVFDIEEYVTIVSGIVDALVTDFGATVILVPHTFGESPIWSKLGQLQGNFLVEMIYRRVQNKSRVQTISGAPVSDELKAVIKECDVFISFMLHPLIASMSSGVPSMAIVTYNPFKFKSIFSLMGQEDCILEVRHYECKELEARVMKKLDYIWTNKDFIHERLNEKAKVLEHSAKRNGYFLKMLVSSIDKRKKNGTHSTNKND